MLFCHRRPQRKARRLQLTPHLSWWHTRLKDNMRPKIFLLLAGMVVCAGCSQEEIPESSAPQIKPPVIDFRAVTEKKLPSRYAYAGDRYRDPFMPLNGEGMSLVGSDDVVIPNVASLTLKGIMTDGKQKIAIISGGSISYVLRGKFLYDNRQRLVRGITGIIKEESVIVIAPDKTTKEIRLRERQ
jgi:hypothetical protein